MSLATSPGGQAPQAPALVPDAPHGTCQLHPWLLPGVHHYDKHMMRANNLRQILQLQAPMFSGKSGQSCLLTVQQQKQCCSTIMVAHELTATVPHCTSPSVTSSCRTATALQASCGACDKLQLCQCKHSRWVCDELCDGQRHGECPARPC